MKIIEEPAFQLENSAGFDALVEREMEALEGGNECCTAGAGQFLCMSGYIKTTTTQRITTTTKIIIVP